MAIETTVSPRLAEGKWPSQGQWTYADYKRLPDDGWRYEVIEGELHMAPAPRPRHQEATINLATAMSQFARSKRLGKVYTAPIDVLLPGLASPVQPDVLFIANDRLDIVKEEFIEGPPGQTWPSRCCRPATGWTIAAPSFASTLGPGCGSTGSLTWSGAPSKSLPCTARASPSSTATSQGKLPAPKRCRISRSP